MRFINLVLLYLFLLLIVITRTDLKAGLMEKLLFTKVSYNRNIDRAVEDAMRNIVWFQDYRREIYFDKEAVLEQFFEQIYRDFDIYGDKIQENRMREKFPAIVITAADGFYLYRGATDQWTEKVDFAAAVNEYQIRVTFQDYLYIENRLTGKLVEGTRERLKEQIPLQILMEEEKFEEWKKNLIITAVREAMEEEINCNPRIRQEGRRDALSNQVSQPRGGGQPEYQISFPYIQYEEWYQTVDQISMLVFFYGDPFVMDGHGYSRFVFGGARIEKQ